MWHHLGRQIGRKKPASRRAST